MSIAQRLAQQTATAEKTDEDHKNDPTHPPVRRYGELRKAILTAHRHPRPQERRAYLSRRAAEMKAGGVIPKGWPKVAQDGGVFDSSFGAACPTCGQPMVGVRLSGTARKFKRTQPRQTSLITIKQGADIVQVNPVSWVVTNVVQQPNVPHLVQIAGEEIELVYPPEVVKEMAWEFMKQNRLRAITVDHEEAESDPTEEYGVVVENWITRECWDMECGDVTQHVAEGTWMQSQYISNPAVRQGILDGTYAAVSLFSRAGNFVLEDVED